MKPKRPPLLILGLLGLVSLVPSGRARGQGFEKAKLVEKVVCAGDPSQSYALFLPSSFGPDRTWPVLFLFDPGARGTAGVEAFRTAAETFGWILVGSNNSRNGPMQDSARAAWAMWVDVLKRLPVDGRRIYASGFSGGARVASVFPRVIDRPVAGIIGCGAGLSSGITPADLKAAAYFGLTGLADFNYGEMKGLDAAFDPAGVPHRFFFFEGVHAWPDPANCVRAVGWMEVMAMKDGLRDQDGKLAEAVVARELEDAQALEAASRPYWAVDRLDAAGRLAEGILEIPGLAARVDGLKARKDYGRFIGAEKNRDKRAAAFRAEAGSAFGTVEDDETGGPTAVHAVLREMRVGSLMKDAKNAKTVEDRSFASRLLFDFCYAARARAIELYGRGDLIRAAAYFDLAIAACEEGLPLMRALYYDRACVAALTGDKKMALDLLATAVDNGFSDLDQLENDKDLDPIRNTDRFREILEKARSKKGTQYQFPNFP